jgi:RING finger protein 113A
VSSANRNANPEDGDDDEAALLEKIPFACIICKQPYKHPVVTRCGHYYCESCALQRYKKNPSCIACGAGTNGVFNVAKKLDKLLERKREREERLKKDAEAEEKSDDDL